MKEVKKESLDEFVKSLTVQKHQEKAINKNIGILQDGMKDLSSLNDLNLENLDDLLKTTESMLTKEVAIDSSDEAAILKEIELTEDEMSSIKIPQFDKLKVIEPSDNTDWQKYMQNVEKYMLDESIIIENPLENLLTAQDKQVIAKRLREDYKMEKANCDKYDYLIAGFSGVVSGLIDSIFVGMPKESKLGKWTDKKTDDFVMKVSQSIWMGDNRGKGSGKSKKMPDSLKKCIGYLEQRFQINYDARYAPDLKVSEGQLKDMWSGNHHLKSLAHAPNIIGLIFSVLDQFTNKASFIDNGKIIRVSSNKNSFELQGNTFLQKLACGMFNWFGHLLSDVVGSSSTRDVERGKHGRGSGLGIPFYELFQFCNFGSFNVGDEQVNLADLSVKVFEKGYDFRHGLAMAIPVAINEITIRMLWAIKQRFYHQNDWNECIPFGNQPELRRMLLVGHGTLCVIDGIDATVKSGGEILNFALRLNFVAWSRFAFSGLMEVRAIYKENAFDLNAVENDLKLEWNKIYAEVII